MGNTTDTNLTLSGLEGEVCSIFVVAYGDNYIDEASGQSGSYGDASTVFLLPSARSNVTCLSKAMKLPPSTSYDLFPSNVVGECVCGSSQSISSGTITTTSTSSIGTNITSTSSTPMDECICSATCRPSTTPGIADTSSSSGAVGYAVSGVLGALLLLSGIINIVTIIILIIYFKRRFVDKTHGIALSY